MKHCRPVSAARPACAAEFASLRELVRLFDDIIGLPNAKLGNVNLLLTVLRSYQSLLDAKAPDDNT